MLTVIIAGLWLNSFHTLFLSLPILSLFSNYLMFAIFWTFLIYANSDSIIVLKIFPHICHRADFQYVYPICLISEIQDVLNSLDILWQWSSNSGYSWLLLVFLIFTIIFYIFYSWCPLIMILLIKFTT